MITVNRKLEKSAKSWAWRSLLGPAMIIDGICSALTVGTVSLGMSLEVARKLAKERFVLTQK
jgi:hypothetical protein